MAGVTNTERSVISGVDPKVELQFALSDLHVLVLTPNFESNFAKFWLTASLEWGGEAGTESGYGMTRWWATDGVQLLPAPL